MLIRFTVSNFLSFDTTQELSLEAGKARKFSDRLYVNRKLKLVKCEALFGANASGKSNLIEAFQFVQGMVKRGFPRGFSNKYYRLNTDNREKPSTFELDILYNNKRLCFGFSTILNTGSVLEEWIYEITASGLKKYLYKRNVMNETFEVGAYFKAKDAVNKLKSYGEDSSADQENLFLTIINQGTLTFRTLNLNRLQKYSTLWEPGYPTSDTFLFHWKRFNKDCLSHFTKVFYPVWRKTILKPKKQNSIIHLASLPADIRNSMCLISILMT